MKTLKVVYLIELLLGLMLIIALACWAQSKPETKGPIITKSYAADEGRYGIV